MSLALDFKLRVPPKFSKPHYAAHYIEPVQTAVAAVCTTPTTAEDDPCVDDLVDMRWTTATRVACLVAVVPMALLSKTEESGATAAYIHLITTPATAYVLQKYNHARYGLGPQWLLALICLLLSNYAAVLLLMTRDKQRDAHVLLSIALILGALQLLWVVQKRAVFRVMMCTATAMLVIALAIVAALAPPSMGRRFFQSATFPFVLLFMETSRHTPVSATSPRLDLCV